VSLQCGCGSDQDGGLAAGVPEQGAQVPEVDVVLAGGCGQPVGVAGPGAAAQVVRVESQALDQLNTTHSSTDMKDRAQCKYRKASQFM